jgi:hypothetical protein
MSRIRLRPEVGAVGVLIAVLSPPWALTWLGAVVAHELGHGVVGAAVLGRPWRFDLQLGAMDAYVDAAESSRNHWIVAALGAAGSSALAGALAVAGLDATPAWAWTAYQAFVFPASDGGVLVRDAMVRRGWTPTSAFRRVAVGSAIVAALGLGAAWQVEAMGLFGIALGLSALAFVVAHTEWPPLVHVEAYRAWDEGRHDEVFHWARTLKRGGPRLVTGVRELATRSALARQDVERTVEFGGGLDARDSVRLDAADMLLAHEDARGARWVEDALDHLDRAPAAWTEADRERLSPLLVRFALFESHHRRPESAAGLMERAAELGPVDYEWLTYAAGGRAVLDHPRVRRLRASGRRDD